jgi:hypothetical protein
VKCTTAGTVISQMSLEEGSVATRRNKRKLVSVCSTTAPHSGWHAATHFHEKDAIWTSRDLHFFAPHSLTCSCSGWRNKLFI